MSDTRREKLEALDFEWNPVKATWERRFSELLDYKRCNGDCAVPRTYPDKQLVNWVGVQRQSYRRGTLDRSKIQRLEAEGFEWDPYDAEWSEMFSSLQRFKAEFGDCRVSTRTNKSLGAWLSVQRQRQRLGTLEEEKRIQLEQLGIEWEPAIQRWERMFALLSSWKTQHGHLCFAKCQADPSLVSWLKTQRKMRVAGKLSGDRVARLNALDSNWEGGEDQWKLMYQRMLELREVNDRSSDLTVANDRKLIKWMSNQ